ncbi:MAG: hypothetical protein SGJ18_04420 [Pseudomonadota bacterium]|nr:hypothetical protein [Pseudomonadota bacterium]
MYSPDQVLSVYEFLLHTPEGALRKMLKDEKTTDVHINLLLKIVKGATKDQFIEHFTKATFPVIKFNANDLKIKETFWVNCCGSLESIGLLSKKKVAA